MFLNNIIKKIYFDDSQLSRKDYHISRTFFIYEGSTAMGIFTLTSGAFLAGFASLLGAGDQFNGIIAAIPVLAGVVQVISPMVFEKLERRKFLISILCLFFRLLLGCMVFIPLLVKGTAARLSMLASFYLVAYLAASFITPAASNWLVNLTPENIRGKYFGRRDAITMAFVTIISLTMGRVLDFFRDRDAEFTGFCIVFASVLAIALVNFWALSSVKEPEVKKSGISLDLKSILTMPLQNRKFRKIVMLFILWNAGLQVGGPFFAVYMVTGLKLNYTYIMLMSMIATITRVIAAMFWGKLADKKSWIVTTKFSVGLLAVSHFIWLFVSNDTSYVLIPFLHVLSGAAWGGIGISLFSIQFMFAPEEGRTVYLGFNAALGGLIGFLSTLAGSVLIGLMAGHSTSLAGFNIGNMQILFGLSGIVLFGCAFFAHAFVSADRDSEQ